MVDATGEPTGDDPQPGRTTEPEQTQANQPSPAEETKAPDGQGGEGPWEEAAEGEDGDAGPAIAMGVIFVGTILLALFLAKLLQGRVQPAFQNPQDPTNPLLYLGLVIVFTAVILLVAKLGLQSIIQVIVLAAVFLTMVYLYEPLIALVPGMGADVAAITSVVIGGGLTALLYFYPEWYIVDAAAISVGAGATGLFGFSFGIVPALVLLVAFAAYDAIAVYRTEHMLDLADQVMDLRLPVMLVVPKHAGYSFLDEIEQEDTDEEQPAADAAASEADPDTVEAEQPDAGQQPSSTSQAAQPSEASLDEPDEDDASDEAEGEKPAEGRDALFMGLGDIVIPGVLVVSASVFLVDHTASVVSVLGMQPALFVALSTLLGATLGFIVLMRGVLKGNPHAGLPALNGGALLGFLAPLLWLYGVAPLIPQF